jgi:hypothetical protein
MRIAMNMCRFTAAAVPAEQAQSTRIAALYALRRPKRLVIGPQIKDENPMAIITPALVTLRISGVVENSAAISGVAGSSEVLEKVTARVIQLTTKRMRHLRHVGMPYAFEGCGFRARSSSSEWYGESARSWEVDFWDSRSGPVAMV